MFFGREVSGPRRCLFRSARAASPREMPSSVVLGLASAAATLDSSVGIPQEVHPLLQWSQVGGFVRVKVHDTQYGGCRFVVARVAPGGAVISRVDRGWSAEGLLPRLLCSVNRAPEGKEGILWSPLGLGCLGQLRRILVSLDPVGPPT